MKIKKLQSGGMPPLFSTFTPVTVTNPYAGVDPMFMWLQQIGANIVGGTSASARSKASSSSSGSSSSAGMPTMKDTMALLKDMDGLSSDVSTALSALEKDALETAQEAAVFGSSSSSLISSYYRNLDIINKINRSKQEYDKAYEQVKAKGGISEAAVTADGKVIVKEKGSDTIRQIDPSEYFKNRDKYQIQTNGNLLYARSHDKNMAFNDSVLNIVQNGTSMEQITKMVNEIASGLGKKSQSLTGYTAKQADKIVGGIQALQEATKENSKGILVDGVYKIVLKSDTQNEQASYAISAIYNSLDENQKAILKLHTNGKDSGALELVKQLVMKGVSTNYEFTPDYQKDLSEEAGLTKSSAAAGATDGKDKSGVAGNWYLGYGEKSSYTIQDESSNGIVTNGNSLPITQEGKSIGYNTLKAAAESDYSGVLDWQNATMGNGFKLDMLGASKVIINGNEIVGAELPIDPNDPNKPNFALLKNKEKADKVLRDDYNIQNVDSPELSLEEKKIVNKVYKDNQLQPKFDEQGNVNTDKYRRFGMITGTTTREVFSGDPDNLDAAGMKRVVSKNERDNYQAERRSATKDDSYTINNGYMLDVFDWFGPEDLYRGTIFIPVKENYFNAISSSGSSTYPTTAQALGIDAAQRQTQAILNKINTQKLQ